jgi:hypothetical protein
MSIQNKNQQQHTSNTMDNTTDFQKKFHTRNIDIAVNYMLDRKAKNNGRIPQGMMKKVLT